MQCGPSCHCVNCKNIPTCYTTCRPEQELEELLEDIRQYNDQTDSDVSENESESSNKEDRLNALNRDVDSIMEAVFGAPF